MNHSIPVNEVTCIEIETALIVQMTSETPPKESSLTIYIVYWPN